MQGKVILSLENQEGGTGEQHAFPSGLKFLSAHFECTSLCLATAYLPDFNSFSILLQWLYFLYIYVCFGPIWNGPVFNSFSSWISMKKNQESFLFFLHSSVKKKKTNSDGFVFEWLLLCELVVLKWIVLLRRCVMLFEYLKQFHKVRKHKQLFIL